MAYKNIEDKRAAARRHYAKYREQEIIRVATWQRINKDKVNTTSVLRRSTKLSKEQVLYNNAKNRAKAKGILFSLLLEDIVVPEFCPILHIKLEVATGYAKDNSPSIDRINPLEGYTKTNIQIISHKANTMKSNATIDEIKKLLRYMENIDGP